MLGKYRLIHRLAAGGMGEVFLAQMAGPQGFLKNVVVKRIHPHLSDDPRFIEMFLNEARLAAQLNHPNIVQVFDFGEADGIFFLAMEHIEGVSLRNIEREARSEKRTVPIEITCRILSRVCDGLAYAHDLVDSRTGQPLHLVHRDISPENILVSFHGTPKVIDFGTAKSSLPDETTGSLKGKVSYMAPERLKRVPVDRRVDIFALGVVLYRMLTSTKPFDEESDAATMHAIVNDPHPPLLQRRPDAPPELSAIVDRALAKSRDERYPDCHEMQADLEKVIASLGRSASDREIGEFAKKNTPTKPKRVDSRPRSTDAPTPMDTKTSTSPTPEMVKPTFAATLEGSVEKLLVRLMARYGSNEIPVEPGAPDWAVVSQDGAAITIPRMAALEAEAIQKMEDLGLRYKAILGRFSAFGENAIEIWARAKEVFPKDWEVNVPTKSRATLLPPIRAKMSLDLLSERFEIDIRFMCGNQEVELSSIRRALGSGKRLVKIKDGQYTQIEPGISRAQQTLAALELEPGAASLPLYEAAAVGDLLESSIERRTVHDAEIVLAVLCGQPAKTVESPAELSSALADDERAVLSWLDFLRHHHLGCILADDRPKARAKLVVAHMLRSQAERPKEHLVVAPAASILEWEVSLRRLTTRLPLTLLSYESLANHHAASLDREFGVLVFDRLDEAPTEGLDELQLVNAEHRVAICPVPSRPKGLWRVFSLVLPGLLGQEEAFRDRFELPIERGEMNALERLARRVRPFIRGAVFVSPE